MAPRTPTPNAPRKGVSISRSGGSRFIYHAVASRDPVATKTFCEKVLGWHFSEPVASASGDYHVWLLEKGSGGSIRRIGSIEPDTALPYCEVPDTRAAEASAKKAGAIAMLPTEQVPGGGSICILEAPGGVAIGLWAPR